MCLNDVVTVYLYGAVNTEIYMKIPKGFKLSEACKNYWENCAINLHKSFYRLKQYGRIWYNNLSEYLLKEGYKNGPICPWVFIKGIGLEFAIITVYMDDLNIIETSEELQKVFDCLKREFEMKDLWRTKFCLGL